MTIFDPAYSLTDKEPETETMTKAVEVEVSFKRFLVDVEIIDIHIGGEEVDPKMTLEEWAKGRLSNGL